MTAIHLPLRPRVVVRTSRLHRVLRGASRPLDSRETEPRTVRAPWFGF
jgi:hypothetical protein